MKPTDKAFDNVRGNTSVWDKLRAKAKKLDRMFVKVGVLASKGGDAAHGESDMSLIDIAAVHEFGSSDGRVPERKPIRTTFNEGDGPRRTADMCAKLARQIVTGNMEPERALGLLGAWAAKEVKNTITESDLPPPLEQSTIDAKGSSKPLLDTGLLMNSISYEVVDESNGGGQ